MDWQTWHVYLEHRQSHKSSYHTHNRVIVAGYRRITIAYQTTRTIHSCTRHIFVLGTVKRHIGCGEFVSPRQSGRNRKTETLDQYWCVVCHGHNNIRSDAGCCSFIIRIVTGISCDRTAAVSLHFVVPINPFS